MHPPDAIASASVAVAAREIGEATASDVGEVWVVTSAGVPGTICVPDIAARTGEAAPQGAESVTRLVDALPRESVVDSERVYVPGRSGVKPAVAPVPLPSEARLPAGACTSVHAKPAGWAGIPNPAQVAPLVSASLTVAASDNGTPT